MCQGMQVKTVSVVFEKAKLHLTQWGQLLGGSCIVTPGRAWVELALGPQAREMGQSLGSYGQTLHHILFSSGSASFSLCHLLLFHCPRGADPLSHIKFENPQRRTLMGSLGRASHFWGGQSGSYEDMAGERAETVGKGRRLWAYSPIIRKRAWVLYN